MPNTTLGNLKRLDKRVYDIAVQRTKEAGRSKRRIRDELFLYEVFWWDKTPEKQDFWENIDDLNFQHFYDLYGKPPTYTEAQIREACTEVGIHSNLIEFVLNKLKEK